MNKLSKEDIVRLYDYLYDYESLYKVEANNFDLKNEEFQTFLKNKEILLGSLSATNRKKATSIANSILYDSSKNKTSGTDKLHHLLRHIRNSFAHGLITKKTINKKAYFVVHDKNLAGNISMEGRIDSSLLFELINQIVKTKGI